MKIIAHRGLLVGPDPKAENQLDTIDEALSYGFDVEVDVKCDVNVVAAVRGVATVV